MRILCWLICLGSWAFAQPAPSLKLNLTAPLDYQVFQRATKTNGAIVIAGSIENLDRNSRVKPDRFEARLVLGTLASVEPGAWIALPLDLRVRRFQAELPVAAGGWYRLELRLRGGAQILAETAVERVGVGDIFIVAGQSNSANHGAERQRTKHPLVVAFGQGRWQPAHDPQPGASGGGGSFLPALGDALAERGKVPLGLAAIGVGATSVREWLPRGDAVAAPPTTGANTVVTGPGRWACTGELYERLIETTRHFGSSGFRAVLWHQGESDNHQPTDREITPAQYRNYLERVVTASRAAAGWQVPWFVAQASYHTPDDPGSPELRAAQRAMASSGLVFAGPNTDELGAAFRDDNGRGVHFNALGLRRHGELWAEIIIPWLEQQR